jgi:hypothetical protein
MPDDDAELGPSQAEILKALADKAAEAFNALVDRGMKTEQPVKVSKPLKLKGMAHA